MMLPVERPADVRLSFDRAADTYDEVRPSYPGAMFDELFQMLPPEPEIVEVGPGTGRATRDLLARGASVHAVEIGAALAGRLRANLPVDGLRVSVGDFERLPIEAGSADAVFAATAYHWIRPPAQTDRPARILRPAGVLAIVDLIQVTCPSDQGFFAAAQPIYQRYGQGHSGPPAPTRTAVEPPMRAVIEADSRFHSVGVRQYDWNQSYNARQYRKLMLSYSATQMMDDPNRIALLDELESFIETNFGGRITRPLVVTLTTGVLGPSGRPSIGE
jgi:SAM-dependent methyltransferase